MTACQLLAGFGVSQLYPQVLDDKHVLAVPRR
jgi:hypothetical protein